MNDWLCDLGHRLSHYAYDDLTRAAASNGRLQSSEVGITHVLTRIMWDVAKQHQQTHRVAIYESSSSEEQRTGADLELWFIEGGMALGWRIQAKRLYGPSGPATPPRFARLDHKVRGKLQSTVLRNSTAQDRKQGIPIAPIYWLYSFDPTGTTCTATARCRCGAPNGCSGIITVSGNRVHPRIVDRRRTREPFSYHRWGLEGTPLSHILCAVSRSHAKEALVAVAAQTRLLGSSVRPGDAVPQYVRTLIDDPHQDAFTGFRDDDPDGPAPGSPHARLTAVIDLQA